MSWKITDLKISGTKGVLNTSGNFNLANGKSIAIFAPNGCGKSGYADAIEFFFSSEGFVEHLGKGSVEHGGRQALPHVLAKEYQINPEVSITLKNSELKKEIKVNRAVKTEKIEEISEDLKDIIEKSPAHRVLRQHDLRGFIVDMDPRDKYKEISRWIGLEQLEIVLKHLTTAKNDLDRASPIREISVRLNDLVKNTNGAVSQYDQSAIFHWCETQIKSHIHEEIRIESLDNLDEYITKLTQKYDDLIIKANSASITYLARKELEADQLQLINEKTGFIKNCLEHLQRVSQYEKEFEISRESTKEIIFQEIWESSQNFLDHNKTDYCPICLTPWDKTTAGSQKNAHIHITSCLSRLGELSEIQLNFKNSNDEFLASAKKLIAVLKRICANANTIEISDFNEKISQLIFSFEHLILQSDISPILDEYELNLQKCLFLHSDCLTNELKKIELEVIPENAKNIQVSIDQLKQLKFSLVRLNELKDKEDAYLKIAQDFETISTLIQSQIGTLLGDIIQAISTDVVQLFQKIQATTDIPNIYIIPDSNSKKLMIRINFHSQDKVSPSGYLSESQINTLALAIFISSLKMFNRDFPFVFLDDIVSSYDADHRARIVDVIAEDLSDFQVILTTHDERFYGLLKSRLKDKGWYFEKISGWSVTSGPKKHSDLIKIEQIKSLIQEGDPRIAGNSMRQFIEEWLDEMCARYEVYTLHKRPIKEYERTIFDFWDPFIGKIKKIKGDFFTNQIAKENCYQRLAGHALLNYYSHWQANPYEWGAIGDVQYVYSEFQDFQKLFHCHSCSKLLKYDHDTERLICTCGNKIFP